MHIMISALPTKLRRITPLLTLLFASAGCVHSGGDVSAPSTAATATSSPCGDVNALTAMGAPVTPLFRFVSLQCGDSRSQAHKLLGQPKTTRQYQFLTIDEFWDDEASRYDNVRVTSMTSTQRIGFIDISGGSGVEFLRRRGIRDDVLRYIGLSRDEVFKRFGTPASAHADNYEYSYTSPQGQHITATFICYDHQSYICSEIVVHWYYRDIR